MKFLNNSPGDIIPINVVYNNNFNSNKPDVLSIVYKDIATGKKHVKNIKEPKMGFYTVKPEYREQFHINRNWALQSKLNYEELPYKTMKKTLGKRFGLDANIVDTCPYLMRTDPMIEDYYYEQFAIEYPTDKTYELTVGFLDIENDIRGGSGKVVIGESPVNAVTFIDIDRMISHTLLLRNPSNPLIMYFEMNIKEFIVELHNDFDESYGTLDYRIYMYDDELDMLTDLMSIIHEADKDFIQIWNMDYDIPYIIARMKVLGGDPVALFSDSEFTDPFMDYREDKSFQIHKKRSVFILTSKTRYVDQMVNYASIRAGKGKQMVNKLNEVAKRELGDEKLDYSEVGNIADFPYENYWNFVKYNIKDVLLQYGIHRKTRDIDSVYSRSYRGSIDVSKAFISTAYINGSMGVYMIKNGYVLGNNMNKRKYREAGLSTGYQFDMKHYDWNEDDEFIVLDEEDWDDDDEEEEEDEDDKDDSKKKKKISGALVGDPLRMTSTGMIVNDTLNQFLHRCIIDMDLTAMYPTIIIVMNLSNETMMGVFKLVDGELIKIPMYNYELNATEIKGYKLNPSQFYIETMMDKQYTLLFNIYHNMKSIEELIKSYEIYKTLA